MSSRSPRERGAGGQSEKETKAGSQRMVGGGAGGEGHPLRRRRGEKELWERWRWAGGRRCSSEAQGAWRFPLAL